jgi:hypothetical protein
MLEKSHSFSSHSIPHQLNERANEAQQCLTAFGAQQVECAVRIVMSAYDSNRSIFIINSSSVTCANRDWKHGMNDQSECTSID